MGMIDSRDREVLRGLAARIAEIAAEPETARRRRMWVEHNGLRSRYPMILVFPEQGWLELTLESLLQCAAPAAREMELDMRQRVYAWEHFQSDNVVEGYWKVYKHLEDTGWGLERRRIPSTAARGSWAFDPVIKEPRDLGKLRFPEMVYDEKASLAEYEMAQDAIGDILEVKFVGRQHIGFHMMNTYTALRGLEQVMMDMYAEPNMLHDAMAFIEEGYRRLMAQYFDAGLVTYNNNDTYHSSGGNGYSDELPRPGADPVHPRPSDMWASAESQEMAQVSPEHHEEFVMRYERRLLEPYGLTGYGCCEDLTRKLDYALTLPRLRRISISPWADVDACAARLKGACIFSWKPNPACLVGEFDAATVRAGIRHTIEAARANGCVLEIILKDTHTCESRPDRFDNWSRIARQAVTDLAGEPPMLT